MRQREIDKLPIKNPNDIDDLLRSNSEKKLKLGLLITNYLVSIIGPKNTLF